MLIDESLLTELRKEEGNHVVDGDDPNARVHPFWRDEGLTQGMVDVNASSMRLWRAMRLSSLSSIRQQRAGRTVETSELDLVDMTAGSRIAPILQLDLP